MKPIETRIAENLKKHRKANNLTQTKLANLAGVHLRYVQDIEAGRRNPTVGVVEGFKFALGCDWGDLLDSKSRR